MAADQARDDLTLSARALAGKIVVGKIGRPHGVLGWAALQSFTNPEDNVSGFQEYWISTEDDWQPLKGAKFQCVGQKCLIKISGVDSPEAVREQVLHRLVAVERRALPMPGPGEVYWVDCVGIDVVSVDDQVLGQIDHIYPTGANDVIVVRCDDAEVLIPFVDGVVKRIDLPNQLMVVDWALDDH